jgi:hypothetical protein
LLFALALLLVLGGFALLTLPLVTFIFTPGMEGLMYFCAFSIRDADIGGGSGYFCAYTSGFLLVVFSILTAFFY